AETLGKAELKGRTFGDTEFVIGHSGSTVPERSGVALSFCGRRVIYQYRLKAMAISVFTIMSLIAELSSIDATEFPDCQNQRLTIKGF
ncbi:hypothetical protein, partial [Pseudomonas lactis]|uniref:hypothetical protein n=1 Tax=Pseudomonas lactis TaxID=1615674 RepID=UPI00190CCCCA